MKLIDADELRKKAAPAKGYGNMLVVGLGYVLDAPQVFPPGIEETWRADAAEDKCRAQGLTLATLCDMVLGEDGPRDDAALIQSVRSLLSNAAAQAPLPKVKI